MGFRSTLVDRAESIATVTFNCPQARNAIDFTMRDERMSALGELLRTVRDGRVACCRS